jgi:hypothetical protein
MLPPHPHNRFSDPPDGRCVAIHRKDNLANHLRARHGVPWEQAEAVVVEITAAAVQAQARVSESRVTTSMSAHSGKTSGESESASAQHRPVTLQLIARRTSLVLQRSVTPSMGVCCAVVSISLPLPPDRRRGPQRTPR